MDLSDLHRQVVETSSDGVWVLDLEGRTLYANPEMARLYGVSQAEMAHVTVWDTLDAAGREQFRRHLADLQADRSNAGEVQVQLVRRDGSSVWTVVSERLLRDEAGHPFGVVHRFSNWGERQKMVEELRHSRERLAEAQRIARIGHWEWDVDEDRLWASPQLLELYGADPETDFRGGYAEFLQMVHEEDRARVDRAVQAALDGADRFEFDARVHAVDGRLVWTRGRGVVRREADGTVRMQGTHQDVTETYEAYAALQDQVNQNALLQAVASAANEAHGLADVLANARSLVLLHDDWERGRAFVPNAERTSVEPIYLDDEDRETDEVNPQLRARELALANRVFHERRALWDDRRLTLGFPVVLDDEVCAVIVITSAPPLYRHEMIEQMAEQVGLQLSRVAERERAQRELAEARDLAMEASRQKSEFLATMSHEIRTPLNGVIGLNDLLLRTALNPEQLRLASGVQLASRALLGVLNDVLDFSKIEAGHLELEILDFPVRALFDQVTSMLAQSARSRGLELTVSCDAGVPDVLAGDPTRLSQVLTNLISNAVKFTERGCVDVRATARPGTGGTTVLEVRVADTGIGVQVSDVQTLFDPFTQADASTTRLYGGTGLGLAICRAIVEEMGGEISHEPNPGGGSVFTFTVVLDPPTGDLAQADDQFARAHLAGRRMLVVDDVPTNRDVLTENLSWWGARPTAVESAAEAMTALEEAVAARDPFDAVLLDLSMPARDGLALARDIRAHPQVHDVPMLLLTSDQTLDLRRAVDAGVTACLTKPVLTGLLRNALLEHVCGLGQASRVAAPADRQVARGRVLVVEDNPVNQMVALGFLESLGFSAHTADDGQAALELLEREPYDAVLMDVQMPRLDGYAATRALRERERERERGGHLPVIAMTAAAVEGERERCLAAGMDDFLTKPVDPGALGTILTRWLGPGEGADPTPEPATPEVDRPMSDGSPERAPAQLDLDRLEELRDLIPGSTDYLDQAIGNFVTKTRPMVDTLREAITAGDADTTRQVAHRLAGSALNLGVVEVGETAREIEYLADGGSVDGVAPLVQALEEQVSRGQAALLAYQASYSS